MTKITNFVWNSVDDCVISELDETGAVQAVYTNEPQQYGGVISQRRGITSHYPHHDALGSTRFLTDSSGNVTDTYLHDAWGNEVASTGTTVNPFKWVGKYGYYTDDGTGQVYVRARMYQTATATYFPVPSILNSQFESKPYNSRRTGLGSFGSLLSRILSIPFLDESETPEDRKKVATCTFQICSSPVPVLPGSKQPFGHLFVICDGKAMRAGPGDKLAHQLNGEPWGAVNGVDCPCDLADTLGEQGRLVPLVGPWDPSFPDHPEHRGKPNRPRNGYPPEKLKCRDVTVSGTCADVCGCMENRMLALWKCCIEYDKFPDIVHHKGNDGDGNSNSAVIWALSGCVKYKSGDPPIPKDGRIELGKSQKVPRCLSKTAPDASPLYPIVD